MERPAKRKRNQECSENIIRVHRTTVFILSESKRTYWTERFVDSSRYFFDFSEQLKTSDIIASDVDMIFQKFNNVPGIYGPKSS